MGLQVAPDLVLPEGEYEWRFSRAGGPGGQNVNKVSSRVELRVNVEGSRAIPPEVKERLRRHAGRRMTREGWLVVTSSLTRDQGRNRADCERKVRELFAASRRTPKKRRPTRPGRRAKERRLAMKRRRAERKAARGPVSPEE